MTTITKTSVLRLLLATTACATGDMAGPVANVGPEASVWPAVRSPAAGDGLAEERANEPTEGTASPLAREA